MGNVGSVQFQIFLDPAYTSQDLYAPSNVVSANYRFNLLPLSLPKRFPLFILASSVCWSLQFLISDLTQGGEGGHLFRLTCSVVLWEGRNTGNNITGM